MGSKVNAVVGSKDGVVVELVVEIVGDDDGEPIKYSVGVNETVDGVDSNVGAAVGR